MKKQALNKDKVLNLQQLAQVSGGRAQDHAAPMDWSTMSRGCNTGLNINKKMARGAMTPELTRNSHIEQK